jgi:hypothetical protein
MQYRQLNMATTAQFITGNATDEAMYQAVVAPFCNSMCGMVANLKSLAQFIDQWIQTYILTAFADLLGLTGQPIATVIAGMLAYHTANNIYMEDTENGLRDYMMYFYMGPDGLPVSFPTDYDGILVDAWISSAIVR